MSHSSRFKPGRNDPCHCGSNKKYKKCCLATDNMRNIQDFEWRKLRQTEGTLVDNHLLPFMTESLPDAIMTTAWHDFLDEIELPEDQYDVLCMQFFYPWALFNWEVMLEDEDLVLPEGLEGKTIAEYYLETQVTRLGDNERKFIQAMAKTYYSFYVVLDVIPNQKLTLRDIFLKTEHIVKEKSASQTLKRGDIVYSRILTIDNQSICIGMAPLILPSQSSIQLIEFKKEFEEENDCKLTPETLKRYEWDTRMFFFETIEEQFNQPTPKLCNTDGDPMLFCKVYCKLTLSPEKALEKLSPLTLSDDMEEFLSDAKRDKSGNITKLEFPWLKKDNQKHKSWDNTVMGHITIQKDKLTVEVNSEARAKQIQVLLKERLGEYCHDFKTKIETPEAKLANHSARPSKSTEMSEDINNHPEAQAILKEFAKKHWEAWLDEPIPALNGQTPRQATKTEKGRELLDALLLHFENNNLRAGPDNAAKPDVGYLRKELGMSVSPVPLA